LPVGQVANKGRNEKCYRKRDEHGVDGVPRNARRAFWITHKGLQ
jgi:hypothetical protein